MIFYKLLKGKKLPPIRLIHPIYLDVPMLVSFAAAIEGGVSLDAEITKETTANHDEAGKMTGKLGFSNLFNSFFDASVTAESNEAQSQKSVETTKESRAHTEASIAILLYDKLCQENDYLIRPESQEDLERVEPGSLVEISGQLTKNAVDSMIDYLDATVILSNLRGGSEINKPNKSSKAKSEKSQLESMRDNFDKDRKRTPISNILLTCRKPENFNAVVTLRTQNLRDLTLSELNGNTVSVVGKVTRILEDGETMSAFENYGLSLLSPELLTSSFDSIVNTKDVVARFSDVQVHGPAIQILPLMIFV